MGHQATLTEGQLSVLRWIAEGCPDGVMEGCSHRISAAALRSRGLVVTSGRGPSWSASATEAGREYILRADGPDALVPRQANVSLTEQLVRDVVGAGGSLRVPHPLSSLGGVNYASRARLAERRGRVPEGMRLEVRSASPNELEIRLVDAPEGTAIATRPVPVPSRVERYHPIVRELRERSERHEVSRRCLPRAMRILQGLVVEAERRGHLVELARSGSPRRYGHSGWTGPEQGHAVITADGCGQAIRVCEEGLGSRAHWETRSRSQWRGPGTTRRATPLSDYEAGATGRLCLELVPSYASRGRPGKWADRRSWTLEEKLPELLREIEIRAAEERHRRREAELKAAERRRQWETAVERARERYAEARRVRALRDDAGRWAEAQQIRAYCEAAELAYPDDRATAEWARWAREHAIGIDPLRAAPRLTAVTEPASPEELRPYLEGFSPYGPDAYG